MRRHLAEIGGIRSTRGIARTDSYRSPVSRRLGFPNIGLRVISVISCRRPT
jgi:hypothetical protein